MIKISKVIEDVKELEVKVEKAEKMLELMSDYQIRSISHLGVAKEKFLNEEELPEVIIDYQYELYEIALVEIRNYFNREGGKIVKSFLPCGEVYYNSITNPGSYIKLSFEEDSTQMVLESYDVTTGERDKNLIDYDL